MGLLCKSFHLLLRVVGKRTYALLIGWYMKCNSILTRAIAATSPGQLDRFDWSAAKAMCVERNLMKKILGVLLLALFMASGVYAQTSKGTITGIVRDLNGAAIPNASVTALNVETNEARSATSEDTGAFRFDAVTPGRYTLSATAPGFQKFDATGLQVRASLVTSYDPKLSVGIVSDTVSVEAGGAILNTENGSLSGTVGSMELQKLPIFSLNPIELLTTLPGVQRVSNSDMSNGSSVQVSGGRPRANNFLIDGQEINDISIGGQAIQPQIPYLYSEATVYTHNAPAEFGRASGGVVNLISQGGTNTFHGQAWELYSGSGLNSQDGQTRQLTGVTKTRYNQHQIGFTAGGPLWKDKLFAFGAGQWTRYYGREDTPLVALPDASGVALLRTIAAGTNPTTAANANLLLAYLNNAAYLGTYGTDGSLYQSRSLGAACPNGTACSITTSRFKRPQPSQVAPDTQWSYRIDFNPWKSDSFFGRYLHDRSSLTPDLFSNPTAQPGFDTQQGGPAELGQVGWTHIFTPSLVNEFRVAETRIDFLFAPTAEAAANPLFTAPSLSFGGTGGLQDQDGNALSIGFAGASFPQGRIQSTYQFQDTISWTRGRHTLRVGGDIGRQIAKLLVNQNVNGSLAFTATGSGGGSIGNFLLNQLGQSGTATRAFGPTRVDPHSWRIGAFFQDDIKLTSDLTVNVGMRYDYFTPPENSLPFPGLDTNNPFNPIATVTQVGSDKNNIAPRVGFSYSPHYGGFFGDGKWVVRGGFGVFFDSDFTNLAINAAQSAPNAFSSTLTSTAPNGLGNATSLIGSIQPVLSATSSVTAVSSNFRSPYTYEYNLGVERKLPGDILVTATYVGNRGLKLYANQQYNYFSPVTGLRLNPNRGPIVARGNFADSQYHGLETLAEHRFSHGILVRATYTFSKLLDDGSEVFTPDSSPTSYPANLAPGGRRFDWGPSAYDHRHFASIAYVWSPTGFHSPNRGLNLLAGVLTRDWSISGISQFQSGAYSTVNFNSIDSNLDGSTANDRPIISNRSAAMDAVGIDGYFLDATPGVYYNLAANNANGDVIPVDPNTVHWLIPRGAQFTNQGIGRNSFLNPGQMFHNVAVEKGFGTGFAHFERGRIILRAEVQT